MPGTRPGISQTYNTKDIKKHDQEWEEIADRVKKLSKKDTMPRGGKHDDSKDFDN